MSLVLFTRGDSDSQLFFVWVPASSTRGRRRGDLMEVAAICDCRRSMLCNAQMRQSSSPTLSYELDIGSREGKPDVKDAVTPFINVHMHRYTLSIAPNESGP